MFDVGFWELVLLGVIALIVLGPERLPEVARTAGRWVGRARSYASGMTQELEKQAGVGNIRDEIGRARDEFTKAGERIKSDTQEAVDDAESTARSVERDASESVAAADDGSDDATNDDDHAEKKFLDGFDDVDKYVDDYMRSLPDDLAEYADEEPFSVEKAREEHARRDRHGREGREEQENQSETNHD